MKQKSKNYNSANKLYPTASITLADRTNYLELSNKFSNKPKKILSVESKSYSKTKKQELTRIYKTLSEQKHDSHQSKNSCHSPSKKNPYHQYFPAYQKGLKIQNSTLNINHKQTKRLSLSNKNNSPNTTSLIFNLLEKLEQIYRCNLDKIFLSLYQTLSQEIRSNQKQYHLISKVFQLIENCQERKYSILQQQLKQQYIAIQQNKNKMAVEIQKIKIKNEILTKTIDDSCVTIEELRIKIRTMQQTKKNLKNVGITVNLNPKTKNYVNQFTQTQKDIKSAKSSKKDQNQFLQHAVTGPNMMNSQLIQKIREYEKKQKQFISVLCLLKKQGVNIEKAYHSILNKQSVNQGSSQQDDIQNLHLNLFQKKKKKEPLVIINYQCSEQADQSIVSQMQGISFNYQDKQGEQDVFTERRKYRCQKQLDKELKSKLKLKINQLYEDQEIDECGYNLPTI